MPNTNADCNLLFGILALQNNFISREQLLAAFNAWVVTKDKPLGDILREQKVVTPEWHALLEALVQAHLQQHGNDAQQSLAAVSSSLVFSSFAERRGLRKGKEHHLFSGNGTNVVMHAQDLDAGDLLDHGFHERAGGFDQVGAHLLEQVSALFGGKGLDQLLLRCGQDTL